MHSDALRGAMKMATKQHSSYEELADQQVFIVDEETWAQLQEILNQPPQPLPPRLEALFAAPSRFD